MNIDELAKRAKRDFEKADSAEEIGRLRVKYVGRKGEVTNILRSLKDLSLEERKKIGGAANVLRRELEKLADGKLESFKTGAASAARLDVSRPAAKVSRGHLHPLTKIDESIRKIFTSMNFSVVEGPEVETEYYNFDALNIPANHPARDMWDTFWLKEKGLLLRTHTSPVQIHYMETHQPPFQIIVPGRVFRYEATDASHEFNFYQVEGLMVGETVTLANFKFVVESFFEKFFEGKKIQFRFRPSYFPFVEPGLEVDIKFGGGAWLEVMGAGMVHREVFDAVRYNPERSAGICVRDGP